MNVFHNAVCLTWPFINTMKVDGNQRQAPLVSLNLHVAFLFNVDGVNMSRVF